jgi:WD40-like Beta Propeller Repeat
MISTIRTVGALICVVLFVSATSQPAEGPTFSDWAAPTNLGPTVNSSSADFGAATSKDGLTLYFTSDRPGGFGATDLWFSQRPNRNAPWGSPVNLGDVINTTATEGVPALSRDEHWLFFNSDRVGTVGQNDIWASRRQHTYDNFGWEPAVNLGAGVNSAFIEAGPAFFENDEVGAPVIFFTSNRPGLGVPGTFDIFVSHLAPNGMASPATLVPELSSSATDQRPSIRFDGLEIFFHSNRPGSNATDLWSSTRATVLTSWSTPANVGPVVNSLSGDTQPFIAADQQTLFFASDRPGGFGAQDLYVTTRTKKEP